MNQGLLPFWLLFLFCVSGSPLYGQKNAQANSRNPIRTSGTVGIAWEYGNLPFYLSDTYPAQNFRIHANATFNMGLVPIKVHGQHNTLTPVSGIPQLFTVSFDPHQFQKNLRDKHLRDLKVNQQKIDSLRSIEQFDYKKLAYVDMQLRSFKLKNSTIIDKLKKAGVLYEDHRGISFIDSTELNSDIFSTEDLKTIHKYNLLLKRRGEFVSHLAQLHSEIEQMERLNLMTVMPESHTGEITRWEEVLSSVRALQIGRVSPNDSRYLIYGTPMNGFYSAFTYRDIYLSAAHGKSVRNNIDFINTLDDNVNMAADPFYTRNMNQGGTTLSSLKAGYGEKQNSHLHLGLLSGKWGDNLFPFSPNENPDNLVMEVDARVKLSPNHVMDFTLGRSVLRNISENSQNSGDLLNPFENDDQNAYFIKYRGVFKKIGLKVVFDFEQRNPLFQSIGMGNLRSDRRQLRATAEKRVLDGLSIGIKYRFEHNNIFNTGISRTSLRSLGGYAKIKPMKNLSFRFEFLPLIITTEFLKESLQDATYQNNLYNFVAVYSPKIGRFRPVCSFNINHYQINQSLNNQGATNVNAVLNLPFKKVTLGANGSFFRSNASLSSNNYGHVGISTQYSAGKWNLAVSGNYFHSEFVKSDWGAGISGNYTLNRFKLSAEWGKQAFGPFLLNLEDNGRSSYPYRFEFGVALTW
jgi:hypothetical protein